LNSSGGNTRGIRRGLTRRAMARVAAGGGGTLALALSAACGGARAGEQGKKGATTVAASGTISVGLWGSAFSDQVDGKVIAAFHNRQDKVKVDVLKYQGNTFTALTTLIAGGTPPDTGLVDGYYVRSLIKQSGAIDLTARIQRDGIKKDDYVEAWFDEFLYKGKYYNFPNMRGGNAAMFYNKNLIEKMGAKLPKEGWTMDEWLQIAQTTTRDIKGLGPNQGGFDPGTATFGTERPGLWWPFLWVNGAELVDLDKNVCTLDSAAAVSSLQFVQDLVHKHKVARNAFQGVPGGADLFIQGRLATWWNWFTDIPRLRQEIKDFEWDVVVTPVGSTRKQTGLYKGNGQTIPTGSKNPDAAWEYMKFLGSYDSMLIYGMEGRFIPGLKKANQDPQYVKSGLPPRNMSVFADPRIKTLPLMPEYAQIESEIWNPNLNKIWNNEATPKEVASEIARLTNDVIRNREKY